jgi:hypothetical protein
MGSARMKVLMSIIRYLHYTIGITTPRAEQERTVVAIWVVSTIVIIAITVTFFVLLMSQLHET